MMFRDLITDIDPYATLEFGRKKKPTKPNIFLIYFRFLVMFSIFLRYKRISIVIHNEVVYWLLIVIAIANGANIW